MTPPIVVTESPITAINVNFTFFPTSNPDTIVNTTAVRLERVAIEAIASDDAAGKLLAMVDNAGEVALEAKVMKLIAPIAMVALTFTSFIRIHPLP
jgi:hypothetical protein